ncbi:MAG: hypothetical protein IKU84_02370 [Clostridia bacterium]|nr:hypothetical protein [Clostridia bacterium]
MNNKKSPWEAKFTWTWISNDEIRNFTQEDFDNRAKDFNDRGITHAIVFTLTHFRLGFYRYWDDIHTALKKLCDACHKYNIKVIEHNSASLIHNVTWSKGFKRLEDDIASFTHFKATVEDWIEVPRFLVDRPEIYGHKISDMLQIDGRTGKIANTVYNCHVVCYNNPEYRDAYKKYRTMELEKVPFDGIMDDDIQWFGEGNACTCEHCRKLFKEKYGYDLPQPSDWDKFYDDYSNPAYVAWRRFKRESTELWWKELDDMYKSLGFNMIRPTYSSDVLKWAPSLSCLGGCMDRYQFLFQENCFSAIMRYSYPDFMVEAIHRFANAEVNGIPSMSMFYPDRPDSVYFGWALSRTWGQLYTGTCEGMDITGMEKKYRDFESANISAYSSPKKIEDVAFCYSTKTRDFTAPQYEMAERYSLNCLGAMQAAIYSRFGVGMVMDSKGFEELSKHDAVVSAFSGMITDEELANFKAYAENGGKFIIYGEFANVDETNEARDASDTLAKLGVNAKASVCTLSGDIALNYNGKEDTVCGMNTFLTFEGGEAIATLNGKTVGIRGKVGKGEIIWISARTAESEFQKSIWSNRREKHPEPAESQPWLRDYQLSHSGKILNTLLERKYEIKCDMDELLAGVYNTEAGLCVNIANVSDTIPKEVVMAAHTDVIPSFVEGAEKLPEIKVSVKCDGAESATLKTPENAEDVKLDVTYSDGVAEFIIPADTFASYALIVIEK